MFSTFDLESAKGASKSTQIQTCLNPLIAWIGKTKGIILEQCAAVLMTNIPTSGTLKPMEKPR